MALNNKAAYNALSIIVFTAEHSQHHAQLVCVHVYPNLCLCPHATVEAAGHQHHLLHLFQQQSAMCASLVPAHVFTHQPSPIHLHPYNIIYII